MPKRLPMLRFVDDPGSEGGGQNPPPESGGGEGQPKEQTFTQADVDKIIGKTRTEERRKAAEKFADYDDLKAKAGQSKTLEDRIADLETKGTESIQRALRAEVAAEFGISTKRGAKGEPSDADLFLTGADEETLRSQAQRLADREADRKKNGNRVPSEGTQPETKSDPKRRFLQEIRGEG